jgi:hypothetical protein
MNRQVPGNQDPVKAQQPVNSIAHMKFDILPWGEIYVDGKKQGVSPPLKDLQVKTGEHKIVIKNKSLKPYSRIVMLNPQDQVTINHRFIAKPLPSKHKSVSQRNNKSLTKKDNAINPAAFTAGINR